PRCVGKQVPRAIDTACDHKLMESDPCGPLEQAPKMLRSISTVGRQTGIGQRFVEIRVYHVAGAVKLPGAQASRRLRLPASRPGVRVPDDQMSSQGMRHVIYKQGGACRVFV